MSDAPATPAAPAAPAPAAPATPEKQPSAENVVTLTKEEHEQLQRDAARAKEAQSRLDRFEKASKRSKTHFDPSRRPAPLTAEEKEAQATEEDIKAEKGLMRLAANSEFREVLDADPTLRDLLISNPLAVLPVYAADAVDAEDALDMVKEALREKAAKLKPSTPAPKEEPKPTPPAGGVNTPGAGNMANSEEYEAAKKNPNIENAVAGMVAAKAKQMMTK